MSASPAVDVDVDKTASTLSGRFTIKNLPSIDVAAAAKPLYAYVGALDLAIEQAKDIPAQVRQIPAQVRQLPAQVKTLRGEVETHVEQATEKATDVLAQLTQRGEKLATAIRRQPATEEAVANGKQAVRKLEASATAARKSAKAGEKAVEGAAKTIG
jgi:F0F1-type ATP synthase membrane subunit b/b'